MSALSVLRRYIVLQDSDGVVLIDQETDIKDAKAAFEVPVCSLWPYKLAVGLIKAALRKGLNLQTNTMVNSVSEEASEDGFFTIETSRGAIKARKVLFATNGYTGGILPLYKDKIIPWRGTNSSTVATGSIQAPFLADTYNNTYSRGFTDYINPRADGVAIAGGGQSQYYHDKQQYYGNTDDSTLIEPAIPYFEGYMKRHWRGYADCETKTSIWTGSGCESS